jgi:hypothetical protein
MHNRLIFRYHRVHVHDGLRLLRGCEPRPSGQARELTHWGESSNEGTQEGR